MIKLKLGTRRSLLAWAQSSQVAREIERLNPGTEVELLGIDTRGDKILDVSLRNVTGKEFFVAELDDALHSGAVDLTVHSMKDLSLERPAAFVLAAIPRRENPRDVILFCPDVIEKLRAGRALRIGTSSPRRLENIPGFLNGALPRFKLDAAQAGSLSAPESLTSEIPGDPRVELVEIRGNVNTRLGRVHLPADSDRALDGVVLAFAGLIRLWADDQGRAELGKLLKGVRWMVLPLRECPAAAAQGALAIECRADDSRVRDLLAKLHDPSAEARVGRERQLLAHWGGGCHQKFGATAIRSPELGDVMYVRGRKPDGTFVEELRWDAPQVQTSVAHGSSATGASASTPPNTQVCAWDGMKHRPAGVQPHTFNSDDLNSRAIFAAHARALPEGATLADDARVWTSGVGSWQTLAGRGIWVEGCAESLGFESILPTLGEPVLQLPSFGAAWSILTHDQASEGWRDARVVATYRIPGGALLADGSLAAAAYVFWGSGSQFDQYGKQASASVLHCCGPGKTAAHLRARGIKPIVFPSVEEWRKWLTII